MSGNGGGNPGLPGSVPGVPFKPGDDKRRGHGLKGKAGRPSQAFRDQCRRIAESKQARDAVKATANNANHPAFAAITKLLWGYAYGPPPKVVEMGGPDGGPLEIVITRRIVRPKAAS